MLGRTISDPSLNKLVEDHLVMLHGIQAKDQNFHICKLSIYVSVEVYFVAVAYSLS